jgi:uncharacterized RDD family membrane protein YckC
MVNAPPPPAWANQPHGVTSEPVGPPAGFWIRFVAYIVDAFILFLGSLLIGGIVGGLVWVVMGTDTDNWDLDHYEVVTWIAVIAFILAYFVVAWLYEAFLTSGPHGATYGKQAVGVRIVRADGAPLSFGRATGRHFLKVLVTPMVPLGIGYLLAAFTQGKRALHDFMADTLVIKVR